MISKSWPSHDLRLENRASNRSPGHGPVGRVLVARAYSNALYVIHLWSWTHWIKSGSPRSEVSSFLTTVSESIFHVYHLLTCGQTAVQAISVVLEALYCKSKLQRLLLHVDYNICQSDSEYKRDISTITSWLCFLWNVLKNSILNLKNHANLLCQMVK